MIVHLSDADDRALARWLHFAFFVAVLFPYLRVLPTGSDVQPTALALGAVVILASATGRFPRIITPLFVVLAASLLVGAVTGVNATAVRGMANYFSLCVISFATYSALKARGGLSRRLVAITVWVWFSVGLLQFAVSRSFMTGLLSNARTTANRGVVGLAPEPTAYGIHCLILLVLVQELFDGRARRVLVGALWIQILVFAQSSMTILILLTWGLLHLAANAGARKTLIGGSAAVVVGAVVVRQLAALAEQVRGVRVLDLLRLVVSAPALVLARDESVSERVGAVFFSLFGAVNGWLLPHGFVSWRGFIQEAGPRFARYIPHYSVGDRIMSGYGAALYELGFVGLLVPFVVTQAASLRYAHDRKRFITIALLLNLLFLMALPLAYPPIGFLIGYFCYYGITGITPNVVAPAPLLSGHEGSLPA